MRVAVLMGGSSEERPVSLASGCEVAVALRSRGHDVVSVDSAVGLMSRELEERILSAAIGDADVPDPDLTGRELPEAKVITTEPALRSVDVAFLALHGGAGEDGRVQTLLGAQGIPFAGSRAVGCVLAMDKDLTKQLFRAADVRTPDWISGPTDGALVSERLGLPVIVKPMSGGSSVRLTLARSVESVDQATSEALGGGDEVMYEAYVAGREFTVGVLAGEPLPVVEIIPENEFFDFESKYQDGMAQEIAPARISDVVTRELQAVALQVHDLLRLEHFSRVDFMIEGNAGDGGADAGGVWTAWCLEANALPGLTANSLLPKSAAAAGIDFPELCEAICKLGMGA
ncbi:MAG: D-alanine--D-alanine ligase [Longimicrobiales bacterium]